MNDVLSPVATAWSETLTPPQKVNATLDFGHGVVALYSGIIDHVDDAIRIYKRRLRERPLKLTDYKEALASGSRSSKTPFREGVRSELMLN